MKFEYQDHKADRTMAPFILFLNNFIRCDIRNLFAEQSIRGATIITTESAAIVCSSASHDRDESGRYSYRIGGYTTFCELINKLFLDFHSISMTYK